MKRPLLYTLLLLVTSLALFPQPGQTQQAQAFERLEVMIPMRDGIKLNTHIFVPKDTTGPLPILLERTPYQAPRDRKSVV